MEGDHGCFNIKEREKITQSPKKRNCLDKIKQLVFYTLIGIEKLYVMFYDNNGKFLRGYCHINDFHKFTTISVGFLVCRTPG